MTSAYEPNKRVMLKVKHERACDCFVAGFRWHKRGEKTKVRSLLLGLGGRPFIQRGLTNVTAARHF